MDKLKLETFKNICIDESVCLRSEMYSFKCGDDIKNKMKGVGKAQSKQTKFEECEKCLHGEKDKKECNIYILKSSE